MTRKSTPELFKSKGRHERTRRDAQTGHDDTGKAFEKIKIDKDIFARMSTQEVQMSIYGNSLVQGSPEQLEKFKEEAAGEL